MDFELSEIKSIVSEEVESRVSSWLDEIVARSVEKYLANFATSGFEKFCDTVWSRVQIVCAEKVRSIASTEIGNRLRCGIYDAGLANMFFKETIDNEMKTAFQSRVRAEIDKEIKSYIKTSLQETMRKFDETK